jgi:hypothetical protein
VALALALASQGVRDFDTALFEAVARCCNLSRFTDPAGSLVSKAARGDDA